jgi:hypothetical protein
MGFFDILFGSKSQNAVPNTSPVTPKVTPNAAPLTNGASPNTKKQNANSPALEPISVDQSPISGGGKAKYNGRSYVVRTGSRGGKYIIVKGKKVYL